MAFFADWLSFEFGITIGDFECACTNLANTTNYHLQ